MGNKKQVLIVDDDIGTSETLSDILIASGFNTTTVESGKECLEAFKQKHFDVVLMDIKMPGMNGVEAFKKLQEMNSKIKVIMMTAYAVNDLVAEALRDGVFSVAHKPLDLEKLISLLRG
jgi:DNA-binding NtrC family response regulator